MTKQRALKKKRARTISAGDVGRFLKHFAATLKDPQTGNPAMSDALLNLSTILIDAKLATVETATTKFVDQGGFDFDDDIDFGDLSTEAVQKALTNSELSRAQLVILGVERFGIARSRLDKLPRDEIVRLITAASQHEESLDLISEEARRGGQARSS
ncbi:hypothetical protein [Methylobacterium sp. Leaf86]|uniref:hypothetical protein n=1 Tax=Methylobacterium sp. Leaf86 TaxID=1736242 RepID=UPI0012E829A3|nr:hypothetical protein [Methylobacterium sp. Leaf86]